MKLVESKLTSNIDLRESYPAIFSFLDSFITIKYVKPYVIDSTDVLYLETYEHRGLFIFNFRRAIKDEEIELAKNKLLGEASESEVVRNILTSASWSKNTEYKKLKDAVLIREQ